MERRALIRRLGAFLTVAFVLAAPTDDLTAQQGGHGHHHGHAVDAIPGQWRMPPMPPGMFMLPGIEFEVPRVGAYLPGAGLDPADIPTATPREVVRLQDGDTLHLDAMLVRRTIGDHEFVGYGFNGQHPGPQIEVDQEATIFVRFTNNSEWPNGIHWHGGRILNRFDGVPGLTQEPVYPGETFVYELRFPDPGLFWYHPHSRAELTLGLGLFANILVNPIDETHYGTVHRSEVLMLNDLLFDDLGLFPYGLESPTHTLMGRFGNVLLVNGEPEHQLEAKRGEAVRFFLTNASNARTFNLSFTHGEAFKLVASDVSRFEREQWIESLVIAPGERYVIDVLFDLAGETALVNDIQALDHVQGRFFRQVDTLSVVRVSPAAPATDLADSYRELRSNRAVSEDVAQFRPLFDKAPDLSLTLSVQPGDLPIPLLNFIQIDTTFYPPVEWNDGMPEMNWLATGENLHWKLRDDASGLENMDISWEFDHGEVVKLRIFNDPSAFHPMHHPIHLHGQRFLVLSMDGVPRTNFVWKDTSIIPTGSTVDLLVEMSNPGIWMLHCHILEHAEAGMMMTFTVNEPDTED